MILAEHLQRAADQLLPPDRPVMVHASLRSFKAPVNGGADTVLDALLANGRTVLAPAFTEPQFGVAAPASLRPARNGIDYAALPPCIEPRRGHHVHSRLRPHQPRSRCAPSDSGQPSWRRARHAPTQFIRCSRPAGEQADLGTESDTCIRPDPGTSRPRWPNPPHRSGTQPYDSTPPGRTTIRTPPVPALGTRQRRQRLHGRGRILLRRISTTGTSPPSLLPFRDRRLLSVAGLPRGPDTGSRDSSHRRRPDHHPLFRQRLLAVSRRSRRGSQHSITPICHTERHGRSAQGVRNTPMRSPEGATVDLTLPLTLNNPRAGTTSCPPRKRTEASDHRRTCRVDTDPYATPPPRREHPPRVRDRRHQGLAPRLVSGRAGARCSSAEAVGRE